ncbi:MAG: nitrite reductase [Thermodesulfobacteriota bacterium]
MSDTPTGNSITLLLPAGRIPLTLIQTVHDLAGQYGFELYLSLSQNLRLLGVPGSAVDEVKKELTALGAVFKGEENFPLPRVCVGKPHCNLGLIDTAQLSKKILTHFADREKTKGKLLISIAGCTIGCPWTKNSDISIVASRAGFNMYVGGKGGPIPRVARRIKCKISEDEVLEVLDRLIAFHDEKTKSKQRMYKLLDDPDFPYPAV